MTSLLDTLNRQKKDKLLEWREGYSRSEYPVKLGKNLVYEGLTILSIWKELQQSFSTFGLAGQPLFADFGSAHNHVFVRRRQIATSEILPVVDS